MLGLALKLLLAAAAVGTVAAIVIYVVGKISRAVLRKEIEKRHVTTAIIDEIDHCNNVVKLKDLDNDREIEVHGDEIDSELSEGNVIFVI